MSTEFNELLLVAHGDKAQVSAARRRLLVTGIVIMVVVNLDRVFS